MFKVGYNEVTVIPPPPVAMNIKNYKQRTLPAIEAINTKL